MKVVSSEAIYEPDGGKYVRVSIFADTAPSPLPKPEDIPGYDNTFHFMAGSTIYVVGNGTLLMCGENDNWVEQ